MANFGTLRSYKFTDDVDDIRGAKVYGRNDEKLGKIDDVIFDHQTGDVRYVVVDTGGWLTHKQFLVPADQISVHGDASKASAGDLEYKVNLSKEDIEHFPKFDPNAVDDNERWNQYESSYREASKKYFADSNVLHRADSPNIITPPDLLAKPGADKLPPIEVEDLRPRHQWSHPTPGLMNTSPTAWGQRPDHERLTPVPDDTRLTPPDLETTNTSLEEKFLDSDNKTSATPNHVEEVPFRNADVGAPGRESTQLEQQYTGNQAQPLPDEFVDAPSAPDRNWVEGNRTNVSDAEFRTAEGDSIYNVADPQERAYGSKSTGVAQDLRGNERREGENLGSRIGVRWERFQIRLRDERNDIAAHNDEVRRRNEAA
jgi:sporulation protein YlmC with PRC-barrel domain